MHLIAFKEVLIIFVDKVRVGRIGLNVFIQVPGLIFIKNHKKKSKLHFLFRMEGWQIVFVTHHECAYQPTVYVLELQRKSHLSARWD